MVVSNGARSPPVLIEIDYLRRDWGEVGQVFRVQRERTSKDKQSVEVVYGWTTLSPKRCSPERLSQVIRAHWAVENRLHWRRDVTLGEDGCGVRFPAVLNISFEEVSIDLNPLLPLVGNGRLLKNGGNRTCRLARTTIDTLIRIDVELLSGLKAPLTLCWMDAVNRTHLDAGCILRANTRLSDDVGHDSTSLLSPGYLVTLSQF
jgi:hypothetical protein